MPNNSKWAIGVGVLVLVVGAGVLVGWWGGRPNVPSAAPVNPQTAGQATTPMQSTAPAGGDMRPSSENPPATNRGSAAANTAGAVAPTNTAAGWEDKLDEILGSDTDDTNKVAQLLAMFPQLPEEGQVDVAQHLANLVPDDNYGPLAQILKNPKLPESVLDVLMGDVLNRPNSVKLPLLLDIAQDPNHPKVDEAKDLMELYLDEEDPAKWPQKLQQWLKDNPGD